MYTQINILANLEKEAENFIMDNDRLMFRPFFEEAEKFCAEFSVLIGGRVGIDLLVGREITTNSFMWDLYCDDTFNTAKAFATALSRVKSPHVPTNTVALQTNIRYKEFTISIHARMLFKIYAMDRYRKIKLVDLMGPATRVGYFTKGQIKCVSEEMQLITIYRTLYTPAKLSMWKDELVNERKIYELIRDSLQVKATKELTGGSNTKNAAKEMQKILLDKLVRNSNNVVIGDYAMGLIGLVNNPSRIQFISADDIDQIAISCGRILNNTRSGRAGYKITHVRYQLNIPDDFQILKYTLYVSDGKEQTPIADVFNSSQYEMIPFVNKNNIKVGNPWVLLRFLFIDIWVLKLILNIGSDNSDFIKTKIVSNLERCDLLRDMIMKDPLSTFQLQNYIGSYVDDYIAKKKLIKEMGERIPTYYPARATGGSGIDTIDQPEPVKEIENKRLQSGPIDITIDPEIKKRILIKIVGKVTNNSIMDTLREYAAITHEYSKWGVNKSLKSYFYKNKQFLPFIPAKIETYVDIGCGDGLDLVAIKQRYRIKTGICVDVADFRDKKYRSSKFVQVNLGKPLDIPDGEADLVAVFHSIHHMRENVAERLKDIARITRTGGIVFLKDHDVTTPERASNVDFEHLVYMLPEWKGSIEELMTNFNQHEPMTYYSSTEINNIMTSVGFERLWYGEFNMRTNVYGAVYIKK